MASEMSVIMPGWRLRSSGTAICRKGTPPYRKTTTAKTGAIQWLPGRPACVKPSHFWSIGL